MKYLLIAFISIVLFSGCARLNSIARDFDVNKGKGKLIDAKQRAIIVIQQKDTNKTVVCTEPSPDALSAYAAQLALEGNISEKAALKLAASSQEGTSYIGLRTQSIQLLRDAMYRNCEAYANGALDEAQYGIASRRYQRSMVALLAIEQLTGAIRVPPITITTEGAVEIAKSINEMQLESDAIQTEIDQFTQEIKDINITGKTGDELQALKDKKTKLENQKSSREKNKKAIDEGIANARGVMTTGKTYANVSGDGVIHRSDQHIEAVSDTVYKIFENLNNEDDFAQLCLSYLADNNETDTSFKSLCSNRLNAVTDAVKLKLKINEALFDQNIKVLKDSNSTTKQKAHSAKAIKEIGEKINTTITSKVMNIQPSDETYKSKK